ncbi:hypothetical protein GQR58_025761 [Nymphon striatum]|nr:hypothetical protein GQR58_025761 [Nymphon striatum]
MSLPPALEALLQLILCGCMGNCTTGHCTCKRNGLSCSDSCQCGDSCDNPHNYDLEEETLKRYQEQLATHGVQPTRTNMGFATGLLPVEQKNYYLFFWGLVGQPPTKKGYFALYSPP